VQGAPGRPLAVRILEPSNTVLLNQPSRDLAHGPFPEERQQIELQVPFLVLDVARVPLASGDYTVLGHEGFCSLVEGLGSGQVGSGLRDPSHGLVETQSTGAQPVLGDTVERPF
jgi:hypothetical protein